MRLVIHVLHCQLLGHRNMLLTRQVTPPRPQFARNTATRASQLPVFMLHIVVKTCANEQDALAVPSERRDQVRGYVSLVFVPSSGAWHPSLANPSGSPFVFRHRREDPPSRLGGSWAQNGLRGTSSCAAGHVLGSGCSLRTTHRALGGVRREQRDGHPARGTILAPRRPSLV